jgi:hypothetical protein
MMPASRSTILWCFTVPSAALVLWTAWNLRQPPISLLLIALAVAAMYQAIAWSLRTRSYLVVAVSSIVFLTMSLTLALAAYEFGALTRWLVFLIYSASLISSLTLTVGVARMLRGIGPKMQQVVDAAAILIGAWLLLCTLAIMGSTAQGYTSWHFLIPAPRLTVNGKPNSGYIHWFDGGPTVGNDVIVTVRHRWRGETYSVVRPAGHKPSVHGSGCIEPRLPAVSQGDIRYQCLFASDDTATPEPPRNLLSGTNFVEFTDDDGKRVRAEW